MIRRFFSQNIHYSADSNSGPDQSPVEWDLTDLFPDNAGWEKARQTLQGQLLTLKDFKGRLGESSDTLLQSLDTYFGFYKDLLRLYVYAGLKADENTRISENESRRQLASALYSEFAQATSYISPEILELGQDLILDYLSENPGLETFRFFLEDILREAEHTLGAEAESVLASSGLMAEAPSSIYGILSNADIEWPTLRLSTGEEVRLDQSGYSRHRSSPNREDRKAVFETFWSVWKKYERTMGTMLYSKIQGSLFYTRSRKYKSSRERALSGENIPESVYDTLIQETNANLSTLHRYFRLRAKMLKVDGLRYHDIYPPLVELDKKFTFEDSKQFSLEAVRPLGSEYYETMKSTLEGDWTHVYPNQGKRSGAYMNGSAYDVHPYVLLNHNDDYDSLSTYAHEWGHAMHSVLSNAAQPFHKSSYSIFIAEIASITNERLLQDWMLKRAESDQERLFYLGASLEQMRGTFFRQAMFAEFEALMHRRVQEGAALSGEEFTAMYTELLKRYHGHDQGAVTIDDAYCVEWAFIPHFYYNFYVYQYATSIAGAAFFTDQLLNPALSETEKAEVQGRYLKLLKAGGSDYPCDLLKEAGLDMNSPQPYRALAKSMEQIMDEIEALV